MKQIIAMGGGGFSMQPDNPALDRYTVEQSGADRARVCFLSQASGEAPLYITNFYKAFADLNCRPSHLSLFTPHTADIEDYLMSQDVIYVGGGNTKSMLALWREWGIDAVLRRAYDNGTVLAGLSAGAICWFEYGTTDSIPGRLSALPCLGILKGSCSPHYDGEEERRPAYHHLIGHENIPAGYAFDDFAAGHFIDGELSRAVCSVQGARAYYVERTPDGVTERALTTILLPQ